MRRFDVGQLVNTVANLGVIAGIVFLALELEQNNELLELEARAMMTQNLQDGWMSIATDPALVELFVKDRHGGALGEAEEIRMNAWWMSYLIRLEWQFQHFPESGVRVEALRRIDAGYPSFRRTWDGTSEGARAAGKDNFSPEFVRFVDRALGGPGA